MTLWGDKMQVLTDLTLDKLINLYVGIVTHDKKQLIEWDDHRRTPLYELKKRTLAQDTMILGALRCAKANGLPAKRVDPIEESNFFDGESNPKIGKKRTLPAIYGKECLFV